MVGLPANEGALYMHKLLENNKYPHGRQQDRPVLDLAEIEKQTESTATSEDGEIPGRRPARALMVPRRHPRRLPPKRRGSGSAA